MATGPEKYTAIAASIAAVTGSIAAFKSSAQAQQSNFPPEFLELLQAIASDEEATIEQLNDILTAIANIPGGGSSQGWPPNADYVTTVLIQCAVINTAYQVPSMIVPDNFEVLIKAYPANNPASLIFVVTNPAPNINNAHPLVPNEPVSYKIKDTGKIYLFTNIAGSQATVSVEQRSS